MNFPILFSKYHALGNDYLVVSCPEIVNFSNFSNLAVHICNRNRGIGADGILVEIIEPENADFGVRIFNPDGSEAEKSGNGLRIFSKWLWDTNRLGDPELLKKKGAACRIWTVGGTVNVSFPPNGTPISIDMGVVLFGSSQFSVPISPAKIQEHSRDLPLGDHICRATAVDLGNPHLVVDVQSIVRERDLILAGRDLAKQHGSTIERLPEFPQRTNVQFLLSATSSEIKIAIWERGAGFTLASGSSACAAASVANAWGLSERSVDVISEGGILHVDLQEDARAILTGPVTYIGEGRFWVP